MDRAEKDGEVGQDDVKGAEKRLDGMTKKHTDAIDALLERKEAELLEV
jgi:ribosome recycling factor